MLSIRHHGARIRASKISCVVLLATILAACGGGGGGSPDASGAAGFNNRTSDASADSSSIGLIGELQPSNPAPADIPAINPPPSGSAGRLLISEVASSYYVNDVAWFEVYNPGDVAISLAGYGLRSSYIDTARNIISLAPMIFSLPAATVPPKGYLVIASKIYDNLQNNRQVVYVNQGSATPYWNMNGSLELISGEKTIDFVRFGNSMALPQNSGEWGGANVPGLPSGAAEYGRSIVRLAAGGMSDTNAARDWALVNFATPAGPNDIAPGMVDSDADGIPDSAKVRGGSYGGLDLYAMGARPGRRDLFLEIDYMKSADPGVTPRREALQKLVEAFAEHNIAVHIDAGDLYSDAFDPLQFNLGGGNPLNFASCIDLTASRADTPRGCTSFYVYKSQNFDVRRKFLFHYAIFGSSLNPDGSAGSSGVAEIHGGDLIVTLGNYGLSGFPGAGLNLLINLQASTLMHELGHNLGLRHGGNDDVNYKPNHYSVMNYMYQFSGLSRTPDSIHAAERYYLANNMKGKTYCNLVENSPCGSDFRMSYSNGSSGDLDEAALVEAGNIGRGSAAGAYADWNNDGIMNSGRISRNLNAQSGNELTVLHDFDEWNSLALGFSRFFSGANTGNRLARTSFSPRSNPMNPNAKNRLAEKSLPPLLKAEIQRHWRARQELAHP